MPSLSEVAFKDYPQDRKKMGETIERMSQKRWEVKNAKTASHGYSVEKTIALGAIFLPLALLGRKGNIFELIMEKEVTEEELRKEQKAEEFLNHGRKVVFANVNDDTYPLAN